MTPLIGIKGTDPDESVNATFAFHEAIGKRAAHRKSRVFNPGLLAGLYIEHFDVKALLGGKALKHPEEHISPVAGFSTPGTRVNGHKGVAPVQGTIQKRLRFKFIKQEFRLIKIPGGIAQCMIPERAGLFRLG
jgi:hypothetical protein